MIIKYKNQYMLSSVLYPNDPSGFIKLCNEIAKYDIMSYEKRVTEESKDKIEKDSNAIPIVKITISCGSHSKIFTLPDGLTMEQIEEINKHNIIANKKISKDEAKKQIKKRYNVGDILLLRGKYKDGSKKNEKTFEVKKIIWSLKGQVINALILKQLSGTNINMTLSKADCVKYHVKYEPGLQVYSMHMDFKKRKTFCE